MSERSLQEALLLDDRLAQRGHIGQRKLLRWFCPPRVADFRLLPSVERAEARNVASQIAFEVSDRRARGTVVPTGPDSFLSSEMNAQAEG
jgi:hypothetical protein